MRPRVSGGMTRLTLAALMSLASRGDAAYSELHTHMSRQGHPQAAPVADGQGNLYGTTTNGGLFGWGSAFRVKTDGTGYLLLHSFGAAADGTLPYAALILDGAGYLYGTTSTGGSAGLGTVFRMKTDGSGYTLLHEFAGGPSDGAEPYAGLALDGAGNLYGTTYFGGPIGFGTIFKLKTDGTGFALLRILASADGAHPYSALTLDGSGNLYGTASRAGPGGGGTVFTLKSDGTGFALLHRFQDSPPLPGFPHGSLALDASGNLYGTTVIGGSSELGTVFRLKTDGSGFTSLYSFAGGLSDGAYPYAAVTLDGAGNLYGTTTSGGGPSQLGTIFTLKTDGTGYSVLRAFTGAATDGALPYAPLILDGSGGFFGTTDAGGSARGGTVFRSTADGSTFVVLHSFADGVGDGAYPFAALVLDASGSLYGTTIGGGTSGRGTVFRLESDGTGYTLLHSFNGDEGATPYGTLVLDGAGNLYGTTYYGGPFDRGTVYRLATDGSGFTVLHAFAGTPDGAFPTAGPVLDAAGYLYGTTVQGGATTNGGTVFRLKTDGSGYVVLRSFRGSDGGGSSPEGGLALDGQGNLYGTTTQGQISSQFFRLKTDGTDFTVVHAFRPFEGSFPRAAVVLDGAGNAYVTTVYGGTYGAGTVMRLRTDGSGATVLHSFVPETDGRNLHGSLLLDGSGNLYGTTHIGGPNRAGTVFTLRTDGTGFTVLHSFEGPTNQGPYSALVTDGSGNLYGTWIRGGVWEQGVEFVLTGVVPAGCPGSEGDVAPRPGANGTVSTTDWVQCGRFAAGLDTPAPGCELQKADTAPAATKGNGLITASDWVQCGRYAAGLDPITFPGGPAAPPLTPYTPLGRATPEEAERPENVERVLELRESNGGAIAALLRATGDEAAVGFSIRFDPERYRLERVAKGRGVPVEGLLLVNDRHAVSGLVGIQIGLPAGIAFSRGHHELAVVELRARTGAAGPPRASFADEPVRREIADARATTLSAHHRVIVTPAGPAPWSEGPPDRKEPVRAW